MAEAVYCLVCGGKYWDSESTCPHCKEREEEEKRLAAAAKETKSSKKSS